MSHKISLLIFAIIVLHQIVALVNAGPVKNSPVLRFCKKQGQFAFTFDQGPSIHTGAVIEALQKHNVKATFHPVYNFINEDATVQANIRTAASEGHLIGLSIEEGVDLSQMSDEDIISTIDSRAEAIREHVDYKPRFLRIPNFSKLSDAQLQLIVSKGYVITTYNIDSYDYDVKTADQVVQKFKNVLDTLSSNTKGAFIAVQRDYLQHSVAATSDLLEYVISKGYQPVTLAECLGIEMSKPGSNSTGPKNKKIDSFGTATDDAPSFLQGSNVALLAAAAMALLALLF